VTLGDWETLVRAAGLVLVVAAWASAAFGAAASRGRGAGRTDGLASRWGVTRAYVAGAVPYFVTCAVLWRRLPVSASTGWRITLLVAGAGLGTAGAAFYFGGRRSLGRMYQLSSSVGAGLHADHRLVTDGAYAWCRHPMYTGLALAALGGLLVYRTWTLVFMTAALAGAAVKGRREEQLLAEEFGDAWDRYAAEVPAWIPRPPRRRREEVSHGRPATPAAA
jgi:protein-S-isoprenylcysteine O-methyltransferase Ste14